jgi:hypothetical protein
VGRMHGDSGRPKKDELRKRPTRNTAMVAGIDLRRNGRQADQAGKYCGSVFSTNTLKSKLLLDTLKSVFFG